MAAGGVTLGHPGKKDARGEDAFFIASCGLGAVGVADGVGSWSEDGIDSGNFSRWARILPARQPQLVRRAADCPACLRAELCVHETVCCHAATHGVIMHVHGLATSQFFGHAQIQRPCSEQHSMLALFVSVPAQPSAILALMHASMLRVQAADEQGGGPGGAAPGQGPGAGGPVHSAQCPPGHPQPARQHHRLHRHPAARGHAAGATPLTWFYRLHHHHTPAMLLCRLQQLTACCELLHVPCCVLSVCMAELILMPNCDGGLLNVQVANLGDSGFRIFRDAQCVFESEVQPSRPARPGNKKD